MSARRVKSSTDLWQWLKKVRDDHELHPDVKLALLCLGLRYPDIRPGFSLLSEDMGRSYRQARYAVAQALKTGWLTETHHGKATGDASRYALCFPTRAGDASVEEATEAQGALELGHGVPPKKTRRDDSSSSPGGSSSSSDDPRRFKPGVKIREPGGLVVQLGECNDGQWELLDAGGVANEIPGWALVEAIEEGTMELV